MNYNTNSIPSELKITDIRTTRIAGAPMECTIIRIDTNQGISGYGEVRDFGSPRYAHQLRRHIIGKNPCDIFRIFDSIKQFGGHGRKGGGVSGIEVALMDLAGKAYGIPVYQLLGGKYRDKVRIYCDTDVSGRHTGTDMGIALKKRLEKGYTMLKMDLGINLLLDVPGTLSAPIGVLDEIRESSEEEISFGFAEGRNINVLEIPHPYTFITITEKGLDYLEDYVRQVRDEIGYDVPLAIDHLGHINAETCIKLGRRLEKFSLSWMEDPVPWFFTDQLRDIKQSCTVPVCTGEDIYLRKSFRTLFHNSAVSVIHPDVFTAGGINETLAIIREAEDYGVAACIHMAETPIGCMAAASVAAAAGMNFVAMEFHSNDVPWWGDIVQKGIGNGLISDGWLEVPDSPGLGIEELNDEVLREHLAPNASGIWESTDEWDNDWSHDRIWS